MMKPKSNLAVTVRGCAVIRMSMTSATVAVKKKLLNPCN